MTDVEVYRALRKQFRTLDDRLEALTARCTTDEQRQKLSEDWALAQKNYIQAGNRLFDANAKEVQRLYTELGGAQQDLEEALEDFKRIDRILDRIAHAVRLGSRLVRLGTGL